MQSIDVSTIYLLAADVVLTLHVLFVAFIVIGLLSIFVGKTRGWSWVRNPWFRLAHFAAIGIVTLQSWFGVNCPLTTWEKVLRSQAGDVVYSGSFISHSLETLLYYNVPIWVFSLCYTLFWAIVIVSWIWIPPRSFTKNSKYDNPGPGFFSSKDDDS